jgi:hypothetical protein
MSAQQHALPRQGPDRGSASSIPFTPPGCDTSVSNCSREPVNETIRILRAYQDLLAARRTGASLHRELQATSQVGVTTGTYNG